MLQPPPGQWSCSSGVRHRSAPRGMQTRSMRRSPFLSSPDPAVPAPLPPWRSFPRGAVVPGGCGSDAAPQSSPWIRWARAARAVGSELSVPNSSTHHGTPETGVQGTDPPPERGLVGRLAHSPGPLGSGDRDTPRRCSPVLRGCRRRIRPGHARRLRRRRSALMAPRPPERSRRDGDSALDALRGTSSDPARFERRSTLDTRVNPRRDPVPRVGNGLPQECGQPLLSRADMPRHILADTTTGTGR